MLYFNCLVTVSILWLFLTEQWVGLRYVIVVFAGHTGLVYKPTYDSCDIISSFRSRFKEQGLAFTSSLSYTCIISFTNRSIEI